MIVAWWSSVDPICSKEMWIFSLIHINISWFNGLSQQEKFYSASSWLVVCVCVCVCVCAQLLSHVRLCNTMNYIALQEFSVHRIFQARILGQIAISSFRWSNRCLLHWQAGSMATHSSILAWRIPWIEEPGRLLSMGSQRVGHDWATDIHRVKYSTSSLLHLNHYLPRSFLMQRRRSRSDADYFGIFSPNYLDTP